MDDINIKADVARHLDMSERNLTEVLRGLNIDYRTTHIDDIRTAYIRDLREKAAGRNGDHVVEAAIAKKRNLDINSALQELTLKERMGELLPRQETEQEILTNIITARQELENNLPDRLEHEIRIIYRLDVPASFFKGIISAILHNFSDRMLKNAESIKHGDGSGMETD